jgi:hypothetical protein
MLPDQRAKRLFRVVPGEIAQQGFWIIRHHRKVDTTGERKRTKNLREISPVGWMHAGFRAATEHGLLETRRTRTDARHREKA